MGLQDVVESPIQTVQHRWRGGYRGGYRGYRGYGSGFATGLIIGGAIGGAPYYSGYPYPYPYGYGAYSYPYTYPYAGGGAVAYCAQRFRSYDPMSGTYLGYDGYRHPCP